MLKKLFRRLYEVRNDKGFTLVELLVVVIIIGILAAVAIPKFMGQADKAKTSAAKADLKTIGSSLEMYYSDYDDLPATGAASTVLTAANYLEKYPDSPWVNTSYIYTRTSATAFTLYVDPPNAAQIDYPDDL